MTSEKFRAVKEFIKKYFFNTKWLCNRCGREIHADEYFCVECEKVLPYNDEYICNHCGRRTLLPQEYCETCKNNLTAIDKGRSAFEYDFPINSLIRKLKYDGKRYVVELLCDFLEREYLKAEFSVDYITYAPMTEKAERKRKYNHARLLAEELSKRANVPVLGVVKKVKDTRRQAGLSRAERLKNLTGSFKIIDKNQVVDKSILIIDDVTTTGATAQAVGSIIKKYGAKRVFLLTVASVSYQALNEKKKNNKIKK